MNENISEAFCLTDITTAKRRLFTLIQDLPKARTRYDKYKGTGHKREIDSLVDLQCMVKELWDVFPALVQHLTEYGDAALANTTKNLYKVLKGYDYLGVAGYQPLCNALQAFGNQLPGGEGQLDKKALGHLMNRVKMGYFPTDLSHVDILRQALMFPDAPANFLDPCCGEGLALERLAQGCPGTTYGIELDELRGEEARHHIRRVGFGSFFHSRISTEAFQCLFLNPPYLSAPTEDGTRRLEKSFLADSIRLLQENGILIYIIPYYRATPDVCRVLCENFTDIRIVKFVGEEFTRFKQVAIMGKRIPRREAVNQWTKLSEYMLNPDDIPPINRLPAGCYTVPAATKSVGVFKGAVFNVWELAEQLRQSNSTSRLFAEKTLDTRERHPLLPLNLSQIGLVGASGLMNGLVECDTPHVIKGRIIKTRRTRVGSENDRGQIEVKDTLSNKLIFNVLTPSGLKSLG